MKALGEVELIIDNTVDTRILDNHNIVSVKLEVTVWCGDTYQLKVLDHNFKFDSLGVDPAV